MRRRRGSTLLTVFIVMVFLGIISTSLMGVVYVNIRNAEQQDAIIRTRVAAHAVLFALGSEASRDIGKNRDPLGIKNGTDMTATFEDKDQSMHFTIKGATNEYEQAYLLTCTARYVVRRSASLSASAKEEVKATVTEQLEIKKKIAVDEKGKTKTSARWRWIEKEEGA